jgi:hypothetical protein
MRKLLLIPLVLVLNACATATIHEVCSEPQVAARYKDYDQCYAEVTAQREAKEQRKLAWRQSWSQLGHNTIQCSSTQNGPFTSTTCR